MADGALTDGQIKELARKMGLELAFVDFKSDLVMQPVEYNKGYIVNLANDKDEKGRQQEGTHWVAFVIRKYPNGKVAPMYFDSFGCPAPQEITDYIEHFTKVHEVPYNTKDVQSLLSGICGYYCLAFLFFVLKWQGRCGELYHDADTFIDLFDDLNKSIDFKKNEYRLKHFFRSNDSNEREKFPVNVDHITRDNKDDITVDTQYV